MDIKIKVLTVVDKGKNVSTRDHYDRNKPRGSITRPGCQLVVGDTVTRGLFCIITMEPPIVLCRHILVVEATLCAGNKKHSAFRARRYLARRYYSPQHETDQDRANIISQ